MSFPQARPARLSVAAAALLAMSTVIAPPAHAAGTHINDIDGDGKVDVVVSRDNYGGRVSVVFGDTSKPVQTVSQGSLEFGDTEREGFGAALAVNDLDRDGYADVIIGAPHDSSLQDTTPRLGLVYVLYGSATGLRTDNAVRLEAPAISGRDQRYLGTFGRAVTIVSAPDPLLVVGEPAARSTTWAGGAIHVYPVRADGTFGTPRTIHQGSDGVPGAPELGDEMGAALASSGSMLLVGLPGENVGSLVDAGSFLALRFTGGTAFTATGYSQNTTGVRDTAETGDRFGASVALDGNHGAVGAPNEALGTKSKAGLVQPFVISDGVLGFSAAISQDSPGVPGGVESGDRFGASVEIVRACTDGKAIAVGAPDEDLGSIKNSGLVDLVPFAASPTCPARELTPGGSVLGGARSYWQKTPRGMAAVRAASGLDAIALGTLDDEITTFARASAPYTTVTRTNQLDGIGIAVARPAE